MLRLEPFICCPHGHNEALIVVLQHCLVFFGIHQYERRRINRHTVKFVKQSHFNAICSSVLCGIARKDEMVEYKGGAMKYVVSEQNIKMPHITYEYGIRTSILTYPNPGVL